MRRTALVIGTSVLLAPCDGTAPLMEPQDALEVEPQAQLVDGGTTGIAGIYFPPLEMSEANGIAMTAVSVIGIRTRPRCAETSA